MTTEELIEELKKYPNKVVKLGDRDSYEKIEINEVVSDEEIVIIEPA